MKKRKKEIKKKLSKKSKRVNPKKLSNKKRVTISPKEEKKETFEKLIPKDDSVVFVNNYEKLLSKFMNKEVTALEFYKAFRESWFEKRYAHVNYDKFKIIEGIWFALYLYEPDSEKRKAIKDLISEEELRDKVKNALYELKTPPANQEVINDKNNTKVRKKK